MGFEGKKHRKDIKKQLFLVQLLDFQWCHQEINSQVAVYHYFSELA